MKKLSSKRIIRADKSREFAPAAFRSFDKRPVNYYRHIFMDESQETPPQFDEQEFNTRMEQMLESERVRIRQSVELEFQARYSTGVVQAREQANQEVQRGLEMLAEYARVVQAEKKELSGRAEKSALELAFALAKRIIGLEVETHPELVAQVARKAIEQVMDCEEIRLRVNPDDLSYLRAIQGDLESQLGKRAQLDISGDQSVDRGGCVIETERGMLDARIASQLETLRAGLHPQEAGTAS